MNYDAQVRNNLIIYELKNNNNNNRKSEKSKTKPPGNIFEQKTVF
jgi:hypothetical protein